jgi:hypothetical protein
MMLVGSTITRRQLLVTKVILRSRGYAMEETCEPDTITAATSTTTVLRMTGLPSSWTVTPLAGPIVEPAPHDANGHVAGAAREVIDARA